MPDEELVYKLILLFLPQKAEKPLHQTLEFFVQSAMIQNLIKYPFNSKTINFL
jgi:hypothetical protein